MSRARAVRAVTAAVLVLGGLPLLGASAAGVTATSSFTASETVSRTNLDNGVDHRVDKRTITLKVSQTQDLRGRQELAVSWSGAHPTGGIVADQNSSEAQQEEYPFVLLECRGTSTTAASVVDRLSQRTCWTQDWRERYQDSSSTFPPYRLDRYATVADRAQVADAPRTLPAGCYPAPTQHWIPFIAADGQVYENGPAGCAGQPPEADSVGGAALPSNETFGVTGLDGTGSTQFDVFTATENASLGCGQTVPCSLVAVPIEGISCDPSGSGLPAADQPPPSRLAAAAQQCESSGNFAAGQLVTPQGGDALAVSGSLWWSASNWRNRIVVPLTFAVPDDACQVVSNQHDVQVFGSEPLIQATDQWAPHFCLNSSLFGLTHVQTGEPEARNLVATGSAEAAFISDPPAAGYGRPVVNAPVAVTGFAISYIIDGANGRPYTTLKLDARLLAKLLTESYPADLLVQESDAALADNPLDITEDPEFIDLNPGITHGVPATEAASALLTLSSDADTISALTSYINDDPIARAWLNGRPDPWGMVVNPAYKGIHLPVDQWPLLSTFEPKAYYKTGLNQCLQDNPVPYLPLVAAPLPSLEDITQALQFATAQSTTICSDPLGNGVGEKLVPLGRQTVGGRFMIGLTSLAEADRYGLQTAALEAADENFVGPNAASLRAASALLRPDATTGTWPIPYLQLRTSDAGAHAYPGTMVVYTAVPTSGLPAEDARDYADFLDFVTGAGQQPGEGVGQLADGYLPMTTGNGLAGLAAYSRRAAAAVAAQRGTLPSLTAPASTPSSTAPSSSPPAPSTSVATQPTSAASSVGSGAVVAGSGPAISPPPASVTVSGTASSPPPTVRTSTAGVGASAVAVAAAGHTPGVGLGGATALALVLLLALIGLIGVPAGLVMSGRGARASRARRRPGGGR